MRIAFIGDIVVKDKNVRLSGELQSLLDRCDFRICNFEAPILDNGNNTPLKKAGLNIFQTEKGIDLLKYIGIDLVSLANNHILDYGENTLQNTINILQKEGMNVFGAGFSFQEVYKPYILKTNKETITFITCSQAEFGVFKSENDLVGYAWINHPQINKIIAQAKEQTDLVYVYVHAGLEDEIYPLPEWRIRYKELIDMGADCVVGSHPHIIQGYETYKDKYIFYSLGNFFFEKENANREWRRSLLIVHDTEGNNFEIIPCITHDNLVEIDKSIETQEDIKERSIIFDNNDEYIQKIDDMAVRLWKEYYASYYYWYCPSVENYSIKKLTKYIVKKILGKQINKGNVSSSINETMLLHNIQIETHRWLVERYLYNSNKKINNL